MAWMGNRRMDCLTSHKRDLNPRPADLQSVALPTELLRDECIVWIVSKYLFFIFKALNKWRQLLPHSTTHQNKHSLQKDP